MKKIVFMALITSLFTYAQIIDSTKSTLFTRENNLKFADYLFCSKDYLRAANEYLRFDNSDLDERYIYKLALSLSAINDFGLAENLFKSINQDSKFFYSSRLEILKINYLESDLAGVKKKYMMYRDSVMNPKNLNQLYLISSLMYDDQILKEKEFHENFANKEFSEAIRLYDLKKSMPNKNPLVASILSALIPGVGKIYTDEISDGIFSFITTGLLAFLAYDNFNAEHRFRGWLFTGLTSLFYVGNIYGSYASAQIFNVHIRHEFNLRLDSFIKSKNYFIPEYDLCK